MIALVRCGKGVHALLSQVSLAISGMLASTDRVDHWICQLKQRRPLLCVQHSLKITHEILPVTHMVCKMGKGLRIIPQINFGDPSARACRSTSSPPWTNASKLSMCALPSTVPLLSFHFWYRSWSSRFSTK